MPYPTITINLEKIAHNAAVVVKACREAGVSVVGVTKALCGDIDVADAVCKGGVDWIGDSRIQNIARFRQAGIRTPMCLLRLPMPSEVKDVVKYADMSLVSEVETAKALGDAAVEAGVVHKLVLMVDLGDLREGLMPQKVLRAAKKMAGFAGVDLHGVGVNFACYGGVVPTRAKLERLVAIAKKIRKETGLPLPIVSGGNSASLYLLKDGIPAGVNQLRIGEGILLGRETIYREPLDGAYLDAFRLNCEIIELQKKPSVPDGEIATDAFGNVPVFVDKGERKRAILAVGRHDVIVENLVPLDAGAEILGASSDHLLMDVSDVSRPLGVGSIMQFELKYGALISAAMSAYVTKVIDPAPAE